MKNLFALLMVTTLVWMSGGSYAQEPNSFYCKIPCCEDIPSFYAKIFGGANFLQTETHGGIKSHYQSGYIVGGSLGYRWCYGISLEAEYAFRRNAFKSIHFFGRTFSMHGHFQSSSYMANLLWDLPLYSWECNFWGIQPCIGAGIGYDFQRIHGHNDFLAFNSSKKHFAWQAIVALTYPLFCKADVSLGYKFHKGGFHYINNHSIELGLMYNF